MAQFDGVIEAVRYKGGKIDMVPPMNGTALHSPIISCSTAKR